MAKKYTVISSVRYDGVLHREGTELALEDKETSGIEHCLKAAAPKAPSKPADSKDSDGKGDPKAAA